MTLIWLFHIRQVSATSLTLDHSVSLFTQWMQLYISFTLCEGFVGKFQRSVLMIYHLLFWWLIIHGCPTLDNWYLICMAQIWSCDMTNSWLLQWMPFVPLGAIYSHATLCKPYSPLCWICMQNNYRIINMDWIWRMGSLASFQLMQAKVIACWHVFVPALIISHDDHAGLYICAYLCANSAFVCCIYCNLWVDCICQHQPMSHSF